MKLKSILLTALATMSLATATLAQVPNYLPTNGLVGWWPFNGNANDESGNGNNGTVNGATLTTDRNGNPNKAYSFDGVNDFILVSNSSSLQSPSTSLTMSAWFKIDAWDNNFPPFGYASLISKSDANSCQYRLSVSTVDISLVFNGVNLKRSFTQNSIQLGTWNNLVVTINQNGNSFYLNGSIIGVSDNQNAENFGTSQNIEFGRDQLGGSDYINGKIDDIGIWNRALTPQEITDLYNAVNCANNTTITPQTNSLPTGSTATFTATTSDPNPSYVWQSNFGQGFQTLNNFGNYSGVNTATLNVANVQLPNHTQPIRVISTSGNCIDTSNVAVINIIDTCITSVTVYDTLLTTVTDTLVINTQITGINPPNNLNSLKVYPNPANTHITIDYGNFNAMSGYTLTILNSIGQTVFTTPINQQTSYIDLSTWTGNGIYFVQIIDPQNNTIENRKIVIQ